MPYMIIRSWMIPRPNQLTFTGGTFLEFHVADSAESALMGKPLDARKCIDDAGFCSYHTTKPPYFVLDTLEAHGYKVVAAHTVKETSTQLVWTPQKPAM